MIGQNVGYHNSIKRFFSGLHACVNGADALTNWINAWTPEKNRLILVILQSDIEYKSVFLHIPGLNIAQIKIQRNVANDFGT